MKTTKNKKPMIELKNIRKSYGKVEVLNGISFSMKETEKVAILGANGAGKSTLVEIIAQIKEPTTGSIKYSFGTTKKDISKNIGIQFQESVYPLFFLSMDIIRFVIESSGLKMSKNELNKWLDIFMLKDIVGKQAADLSGGQKQRMNILLAMITNPKLLLLDEVSNGLDIEARTEIKAFIKKLVKEQNKSLILVSHNPDEIEYLCDRVIVIHKGLIYEDVSVKHILKKHTTVANYLDNLFMKEFKNPAKKTVAKNTPAKKPVAKKTVAKKPVAKKTTKKAVAKKKPITKKVVK